MCTKDCGEVSIKTIGALSMLDPHKRHQVSSASVTRLLNRFYKQCSTDEVDAVLEEWHEYQSLPDNQLPEYTTLEDFWASMAALPQPAGEVGSKRFGDLANFVSCCWFYPTLIVFLACLAKLRHLNAVASLLASINSL